MSTEYQIKVNYNSANNAANELDSIAASLANLANSMLDGTLIALGNAWVGENADRFIKKGIVVKEQILSTAKDVRDAAEKLRNDARTTYNVEMKTLKIAAQKAAQEQMEKKQIGRSFENGGSGSFGGGGGGSR